MGNSLKLLRALLWFICAFHITVGIGLNASSGFLKVMASFYGAQVDWTPQFVYILKPLGAFMFVFGLLAAVAALNPLRHRPIIYAFVSLFVIRSLQRVVFGQEVYNAFAITPARNLGNMVLFLLLAASLLGIYRHVEKAQPRGTGATGK